MEITFYGATREVTGSAHLAKFGSNSILFDCGMFQGRRKRSKKQAISFHSKYILKSAKIRLILFS